MMGMRFNKFTYGLKGDGGGSGADVHIKYKNIRIMHTQPLLLVHVVNLSIYLLIFCAT